MAYEGAAEMPVSAFAARQALQNSSQQKSDSLQSLTDAVPKRRRSPSSAVPSTAQETEACGPFEESSTHYDHPVSPSVSLLQPPTISKSHSVQIDWSSESSDTSSKLESPEIDAGLQGNDVDGGSGVEVGSSRFYTSELNCSTDS